MSNDKILTEVVGKVLKITLNNSEKYNSFDPQMMHDLAEAYTRLDQDTDLWVGVLCADGDNFTAGLDMPKFFGPDAEKRERPEGQVDPFGLAKKCSKPIVVALQGICYTIGIEMMLAGDIAVAADDTRFQQLESARGIAPLGGAHFRYIQRAGWGNAMYHLMLCDKFSAQRAKEIGLVQEVVPKGQQIERAMELAKLICGNAPLGIQAMKRSANIYYQEGEQAAIDIIPTLMPQLEKTEDFVEGIQSFMQRRSANFQGK